MKYKFLVVLIIISVLLSACVEKAESVNKYTAALESDCASSETEKEYSYVLNIKSKKIHKDTCGTGDLILPENRREYTGEIEELLSNGYTYCGNCFRDNYDMIE